MPKTPADKKCDNCIFKSEYTDMYFRMDECSIEDDLEKAVRACSSSSPCKNKITREEARFLNIRWQKLKEFIKDKNIMWTYLDLLDKMQELEKE